MFIDRCNIDFIKVLSKDFMNQKLVKSVLRLNKPVYDCEGHIGVKNH